jgi:hypothetical protein
VDRYLKPVRDRMAIKGISTTKPSPLLRNSITIRTCADEAPQAPGVIEADTAAHCGPTLIGEFVRTLTMTDLVIGWTENHSIRNNASKWIVEGIEAKNNHDGRRKRIYDKPATPWQRLQESGTIEAQQLSVVAARVEGTNPADLTRQINTIQMQLLDLAKTKTEALDAARHIDLEALDPSINRLAKAE